MTSVTANVQGFSKALPWLCTKAAANGPTTSRLIFGHSASTDVYEPTREDRLNNGWNKKAAKQRDSFILLGYFFYSELLRYF